MPTTKNQTNNSNQFREVIFQFFDLVKEERTFILLIGVLFFVAAVV